MPALNENFCFCICILIDFSSCFDTVPRDKLLQKLNRYGVWGKCAELMSSFLQNHKQYVHFKSNKSGFIDQCMGFIQGSKSGTFYTPARAERIMDSSFRLSVRLSVPNGEVLLGTF